MKLHQDTSFCTSEDGTRIAVASCGCGPVILRAAHWLSHVAYDLESPVWRPWIEALSRNHRYVRYDPRGCGLSERHCADLTLRAWHQDLEAVAATIPDSRFALLGVSRGGQTRARNDAQRLEAETLINFVRVGSGRANPARALLTRHPEERAKSRL